MFFVCRFDLKTKNKKHIFVYYETQHNVHFTRFKSSIRSTCPLLSLTSVSDERFETRYSHNESAERKWRRRVQWYTNKLIAAKDKQYTNKLIPTEDKQIDGSDRQTTIPKQMKWDKIKQQYTNELCYSSSSSFPPPSSPHPPPLLPIPHLPPPSLPSLPPLLLHLLFLLLLIFLLFLSLPSYPLFLLPLILLLVIIIFPLILSLPPQTSIH